MPVYVVCHIDVEDAEGWRRYREIGMPTIAAAGGRVLAAGQGVALEGTAMPTISAVVEFPTAEAAERWYYSDAYREASVLRLRASRTLMFGIVPGT